VVVDRADPADRTTFFRDEEVAQRENLHIVREHWDMGGPGSHEVTKGDPWLFIGKMQAYAEWWAGSPDDLGRPEVSPGLGNLAGLPPALLFFGTRDSLWPGGKLLVRRAEEAGWPLTYVEEPGLIHVFPILPFLPEAGRAWRQTMAFLKTGSLT
jgi:acetyl esterase/lipase